tara:strand:- start:9168 stop:9998 length:831 start_codon:yes stop_codon:yes gene_type:complete
MKVTCKGKDFEQYECNEINSLGIKAVEDWRNAEVGDWIRTNDDKVVEVVGKRFKKFKGKRKQITFIRTGFGETPTYYAKVYAKRQKDWSGNDLVYKQYVRNVPATVLQKQFADYISKFGEMDKNGKFDCASIVDAYTNAFSDNNPKQALRRGLRILRKKYISDRISMNIRETLLEHGMDDNWIVNQYRDIIDSAPVNAKLNALNRVSELLGHTRKEKEEKTQNIIMISDGDKKLLSEARQKLSDKDIGRLMNVVKNKGIQGVIDEEDTRSDNHIRD